MASLTARLNKGFRDVFAGEQAARWHLIDRVRAVYERYGYTPLETPALEYVEVLGKFLPESQTPEGGIFAFRNETGTGWSRWCFAPVGMPARPATS